MFPDQRQFERLPISEGEVIALDEGGRRLGRVSHAAGGGMTIELDDTSQAKFGPGDRIRIVIEEPPAEIRHSVTVEVKYRVERSIGVKFVTPA